MKQTKPGDIIRITADNEFKNQEFTVVENPDQFGSETFVEHRGEAKIVPDNGFEIIKTNNSGQFQHGVHVDWEQKMKVKRDRAMAKALGFKG